MTEVIYKPEGVTERGRGAMGVQPEHFGREELLTREASSFWARVGPPGPGSAQLEAGRALDGVQQLAAQQGLVVELGELQQVHAGAGRGQPLQVGAAVVNAEGRVQLLEDSARQHGRQPASGQLGARRGCRAPEGRTPRDRAPRDTQRPASQGRGAGQHTADPAPPASTQPDSCHPACRPPGLLHTSGLACARSPGAAGRTRPQRPWALPVGLPEQGAGRRRRGLDPRACHLAPVRRPPQAPHKTVRQESGEKQGAHPLSLSSSSSSSSSPSALGTAGPLLFQLF